jgi:hypothetical protein
MAIGSLRNRLRSKSADPSRWNRHPAQQPSPGLESDPESLFLVSLRSVSRMFSISTFCKKRLSGWTSRADPQALVSHHFAYRQNIPGVHETAGFNLHSLQALPAVHDFHL